MGNLSMAALMVALSLPLGCAESLDPVLDAEVADLGADAGRDLGSSPDFGPPSEPCPEPIDLSGVEGPEGPYPAAAHVTVVPVGAGGWGQGVAEMSLSFASSGEPHAEAFAWASFGFDYHDDDPIPTVASGTWTDVATDRSFEATIEVTAPDVDQRVTRMGTLEARVTVPELGIALVVDAPWCDSSAYL